MQRREFLKLGATLSPSHYYQVGAVSHSPKLTRLHSLFHLKLAQTNNKRLFLISNKVFPSLLLQQVQLLGGITVAY